ncbi:hypothetical protein LSAT2_013876, partial [Lamellibrachia satsuma]
VNLVVRDSQCVRLSVWSSGTANVSGCQSGRQGQPMCPAVSLVVRDSPDQCVRLSVWSSGTALTNVSGCQSGRQGQ